jgi:hypothetical protein
VKGGEEILEYEAGGEKDGRDSRKMNNDRNAQRILSSRFHQPIQVVSGNVFRRELSLASTTRQHKGVHGCASIQQRRQTRGIDDRIGMTEVVG